MSFADKDSLHIPYPSWAKDGDVDDDRDFENWKELQRWADRLPSGGAGGAMVIDAGDGAVITGYTKAFYITHAGTLSFVVGTLSSAGSTDTVVDIIHNGYTIGTLIIPAGELSATLDLGLTVSVGDYWQVQQITAGTGATSPTYYGVLS